MCVGIVAFGVYAFLVKPSPAERTYFEADANGQLRRVERPSVPARSTPKLWKPEPRDLLARQSDLRLRPAQVQGIKAVDASWQRTKLDLERRLSAETAFLAGPSGGTSVVAIQGGLDGYSELSRRFGRERENAWTRASAVLDKEQMRQLEQLIAKEASR